MRNFRKVLIISWGVLETIFLCWLTLVPIAIVIKMANPYLTMLRGTILYNLLNVVVLIAILGAVGGVIRHTMLRYRSILSEKETLQL